MRQIIKDGLVGSHSNRIIFIMDRIRDENVGTTIEIELREDVPFKSDTQA